MTISETWAATVDLDQLYSLARMLGADTARLIHDGRDAAVLDVDTKSDPTDVVTAMDRAAERLLRERIGSLRPEDGVHGEEHDELAGTSGVRWIIDPIDGTVNYLYGLGDCCVSIAVEVNDELVIGVVTVPRTGQQFHARRGGGAFLDDLPIRPSTPERAALSLVATGFGYLPEQRANQGAVVAALLPDIRDIRRLGSAALDLCNVASGRVDAYYEWGTHIWDWAAGAVICRESGAHVQLPDDDEGLVLAAAPGVARELSALVRGLIDPAWGVPA